MSARPIRFPVRSRRSLRLTHPAARAAFAAVEPLEARVLFSGGPLNYSIADNLDHSLTLSVQGSTLQLSDNGVVQASQALANTTSVSVVGGGGNDTLTIDFSNFAIPAGGIQFDGGAAGADRLVLQSGSFASETIVPSNPTSGSITLNTMIGSAANVGFARVSGITDLAPVTSFSVSATSAAEQLNVENGSSVGGVATTRFDSGSSGTFAPVDFAHKTHATINGVGGADLVTVNTTAAAAGLATVTVDTGTGADTVFVRATAPGVSVAITSTASSPEDGDQVTIGNNGSVQGILGPVDVSDDAAYNNIVIDDSIDATGRSVTYSSSSVTGLAPAAITYNPGDVGTITINGGSGGNTFTVADTVFSSLNTLNTGTGNDLVNVQSVLGGSTLQINGQGGSDRVNVGLTVSGGSQSLMGLVVVTNAGGSTAIVVDATAENVGQSVAVAPAAVTINSSLLGPFDFVPEVDYSSLGAGSSLAVKTGGGADTFNVSGTSVPTTLDGGDGADAYSAGFVGLTAPLTIADSGSTGVDSATLTGTAAGETFVVGPVYTTLNSAAVNYDGKLEQVSVAGGAGDDTFNVTPSGSTTFFIDGGSPTPSMTPAGDPGDAMSLATAGLTNVNSTIGSDANGYNGQFNFGNAMPVNFDGLESSPTVVAPPPPPMVVDLQLALSGPATATEGATLTYSFTVTNVGNRDATNVVISVSGTNQVVSMGTVAAGGSASGTFSMAAGEEGSLSIIASAASDQADQNPSDNSANAATTITDPAVIASALTLSATEGTALNGATLATFTDPGLVESVGSYSATIDWGDHSTSAGVVTFGSGTFTVSGGHLYTVAGNYTTTVTIHHGTATDSVVSGSVNVADPSVVMTGGFSFAATKGLTSANQVVATFTDPGGAEGLTHYSAMIAWGDSTSSTGSITFNAGTGVFTVSGSHTYAVVGKLPVVVTVNHDSSPAATVSDTANIAAPAAITMSNIAITSPMNEGGTAHLTGSVGGAGGAMTLAVNWGDGSSSQYALASGATAFDVTHLYKDNPASPATAFTVSVKLSGSAGSASATLSAKVNDVAPIAGGISGPNAGVRGQRLDFSDLFTDAGVLDTHTAVFNWGDGTTSSRAVTESKGTGSVSGHHVFTASGTYKVSLTITDKDGLSATVMQNVTVSAVLVEADSVFGGNMLVVGGTTAADVISVSATKGGRDIQVALDGTITTVTSSVGRIIVIGQAGNDSIQVANNVFNPAFLYGGAGNDSLSGGGGAAVLVGNSGNDTLVGGHSNNILIGGRGSDTLLGGSTDDLLIGGYTAYDHDDAALAALFNEWTRATVSYATRVSDLTNGGGMNGSYVLNRSSVFDDGASDILSGNAGTDWFLFSNGDTSTDKARGETITLI